MRVTGLTSCADTRAGGGLVRGLSGGQKRRLSLALSFAKNPAVIVLDEPTSGLDSAAASAIMKFLRETAVTMNVATICTIHQPSLSVWNNFQDVLVLSGGKTAYAGCAADMPAHLAKMGSPVPADSNPAEFILDLVNKDFTDAATVDMVLRKWSQKAPEPRRLSILPRAPSDIRKHTTTSLPMQLFHLVCRHLQLTYRDPMLYAGRALFYLVACSFFAFIYLKARERTQEQIPFRLYLAMWIAGVPTSMTVSSVYFLNLESNAVKREVKEGMYSPFMYVVAHTLIQVCAMTLLGLFALGVPLYAIGNFYAPNFVQMWAVYSAMLLCFECWAQLLAVVNANPLMGMLNYLQIWFGAFLFAGVIINPEYVVYPFRLMMYVFPMRWCFKSMTYVEFSDATYKQAELCDPTDPTQALPTDGYGPCYPGGFRCTDEVKTLQCFGKTGQQVLSSLSEMFPAVSTDSSLARDVGVTLGMCLVLKLLFSWALWQKCYPHLKMKPIAALERLSGGLASIGNGRIEGPVANIARRSSSPHSWRSGRSGRRSSFDVQKLADCAGSTSATSDHARVGPSPLDRSQVRSPASIAPSVATSSKSSKRAVTPEAWNSPRMGDAASSA